MIFSLALLAACGGPNQGTVVGNPGDSMVRLAPVSSDLTVTEAEATLQTLSLNPCDGSAPTDVVIGEELDLLGPTPVVELPGGEWCDVSYQLEFLEVAGTGPDGSSFELELQPGAVDVFAALSLTVDGQAFVMELGDVDWLTATGLGLQPGQLTIVDDLHPAYAGLQDTVVDFSALFDDSDGDGTLSQAERDAEPVAGAPSRPAPEPAGDTGDPDPQVDDEDDIEDADGCGGDNAALVVLWPLVLLGWRRRRG